MGTDALRSRDAAKENEARDLRNIVDAINNDTPTGRQLKDTFSERFGKTITAARIGIGGGRSIHHDIEILVEGVWHPVEHKGSIKYVSIDPLSPPWTQGVQFYNGPCGKYTMGCLYAKQWYDKYIATGVLSNKYALVSPIPSFDDWFKKDANIQGDAKTLFGKELRSRFRGNGKKGGCFEERDALTKDFRQNISDVDLDTIQTEVLRLAQDVLSKKTYWLQIQGSVMDKFYCAWSPELKITSIAGVEMDEKCKDVKLDFTTDVGFKFSAWLRWGKGQGLSNLRIDLR